MEAAFFWKQFKKDSCESCIVCPNLEMLDVDESLESSSQREYFEVNDWLVGILKS